MSCFCFEALHRWLKARGGTSQQGIGPSSAATLTPATKEPPTESTPAFCGNPVGASGSAQANEPSTLQLGSHSSSPERAKVNFNLPPQPARQALTTAKRPVVIQAQVPLAPSAAQASSPTAKSTCSTETPSPQLRRVSSGSSLPTPAKSSLQMPKRGGTPLQTGRSGLQMGASPPRTTGRKDPSTINILELGLRALQAARLAATSVDLQTSGEAFRAAGAETSTAESPSFGTQGQHQQARQQAKGVGNYSPAVQKQHP